MSGPASSHACSRKDTGFAPPAIPLRACGSAPGRTTPAWIPWETYRYPGDPPWAGGTFYRDTRQLYVRATPAEVWDRIEALGGKNGWYTVDWLWSLRGTLDRLFGGIGMRIPLERAQREDDETWENIPVRG
jgi:hypothetical protein